MAQTETLTLKVFGRTKTGKSAAYRARLNNLIPAVVYGPKLKTPLNISIIPKDIRDVYAKAGKTALVTLEAAEGGPAELNGTKVLFKDVQGHAYKNLLSHVDLHQIDLTRAVRVTVPLQFTGKSKGLAEGGIMSIGARSVQIKALPTEIPNHIDVDVSDLGVNESIHISELAKKLEGQKYEFLFENDFTLVAVVPPEEEKAAEAVAADATAAPGAAGAAPVAGAAGAAAPAAAGAKAPAAAAKAPAKK